MTAVRELRDLRATDALGRQKALPASQEPVTHGFTWLSRGDLMAFDGDDEVTRWKSNDNGWRQVEVWRMDDAPGQD